MFRLRDGAQEGIVGVQRHGIAARHFDPVDTAAQFQARRERRAQAGAEPDAVPAFGIERDRVDHAGESDVHALRCGKDDRRIGAERAETRLPGFTDTGDQPHRAIGFLQPDAAAGAGDVAFPPVQLERGAQRISATPGIGGAKAHGPQRGGGARIGRHPGLGLAAVGDVVPVPVGAAEYGHVVRLVCGRKRDAGQPAGFAHQALAGRVVFGVHHAAGAQADAALPLRAGAWKQARLQRGGEADAK